MSRHPDPLSQVFPSRQMYRGQALKALLWSIFGAVSLASILIAAVLATALLETRGSVRVSESDVSAFREMNGMPKEPEDIAAAQPLELHGLGMQAIAWELRHHAWSHWLAGAGQRLIGFQTVMSSLCCLIMAGLMLGVIFSFAMARVRSHAGRVAEKIASQLRSAVHRHALRTGTSDLRNQQAGSLIELFSGEISNLESDVRTWMVGVQLAPIGLVTASVIAGFIDWMIAFECAVPSVACWMLVRRSRTTAQRTERLSEDHAVSELRLLEEGIRHSRLVTGYQLESFEQKRFERHLSRYQGHLLSADRSHHRGLWLSRGLGLLCWSLVLFLLGLRLILPPSDSQHLVLADGIGLVSCFLLGWRSLESLSSAGSSRQKANATADRINRYLNTIPEVSQSVGARFLQPLNRAIEFNEVSWRSGQRHVLDHLTLKIPAGSSTAVIAFDSLEAFALVSLLPRFADPSEGRILIDGQNISEVTLESLRSESLIVSADDAWLTGSVLENITGGEARFSLTQATEAAKQAHAHQFIQKLPQGYETILGEHGEQLEVGQAFRLALARALLRDPALLILIEPSGDVSEDDKALIEDACRRAMRDRTLILLPQRLSTLKAVDRIVLLNRGRVEVVGTHEVLLQTSPLYRHWEYLRFNEFRRETVAPVTN